MGLKLNREERCLVERLLRARKDIYKDKEFRMMYICTTGNVVSEEGKVQTCNISCVQERMMEDRQFWRLSEICFRIEKFVKSLGDKEREFVDYYFVPMGEEPEWWEVADRFGWVCDDSVRNHRNSILDSFGPTGLRLNTLWREYKWMETEDRGVLTNVM